MVTARKSGLLFTAAVLATLTNLGCEDSTATGCLAKAEIPLAKNALTLSSNVRLDRIADGFVLIAQADDGKTLRWARLSEDGMLGTQIMATVPERAGGLGPWFALVGKSAPGDQLLIVYLAPKAGATNQLEFQVVAQDPDGTLSAPKSLAALPMGLGLDIAKKDLRVVMGSSRTGKSALLSWGFEGSGVAPTVQTLKADGETVVMPLAWTSAPTSWKCLAIAPSRTDLGVSAIEPGKAGTTQKPWWHMAEYNDDGGNPLSHKVGLHTTDADCPVASGPTPKGYVVSWQNPDGTYFADYNSIARSVNPDSVAGAVRFGGAAKQPKVACVASMSRDFGILFDAVNRQRGPFVRRFDAFGRRIKKDLQLSTDQQDLGPISAWPGINVMWVTYLDKIGANPAENLRYLQKIECPAAIEGGGDAGTEMPPPVSPDGSTDAK